LYTVSKCNFHSVYDNTFHKHSPGDSRVYRTRKETISVHIAATVGVVGGGRPKSTHSNFGKWVLDTQFAVM